MGRERRLGEGTDERNVCEKEGDGCETRKRERDGKGEEKTFTEEEKKNRTNNFLYIYPNPYLTR